jgi:CheY-like chemotaxis protein
MHHLTTQPGDLPDVLFLDLNMPRKTGFECLSEIKLNDKLKHLPIIIFSTSMDTKMMNSLFEKGANYYIQKPGDFSELKKVIYNGIIITTQKDALPPNREKFIIQP